MSINVAQILSIVSFALPANVAVKIFSANFFARGDTRTPVKAAIISMVSNVLLTLVLFKYYSYWGIAMASTIASWINMGFLLYWLKRGKYLAFDARLKKTFPLLCLCASGMGFFLNEASIMLMPYFHLGVLKSFMSLGLLVGGGFSIYLLLLKLTKAFTYKELLKAMHRAQKDSEVVNI